MSLVATPVFPGVASGHERYTKPLLLIVLWALMSFSALAHPGSGIVVDAQGNVFVADINRGLLKFTPDGRVTVVMKEAGHWLAVDTDGNFSRMDFQKSQHWPHWFKHRNPPGGPALISDGGSPLVIHRHGNLYYVCNDEHMTPGGPSNRTAFSQWQTCACCPEYESGCRRTRWHQRTHGWLG